MIHNHILKELPFILRGVSLIGIDSVKCDMDTRLNVWSYLANDWKIDSLNDNAKEVTLEDLGAQINQMLEGKHTGRTIVSLEK